MDILRCTVVIAHGIDIVDIARIEGMLERHGDRFLARCFTPEECAYAEAGGRLRAERYAVRFAAKEAALKCLGTGWTSGVEWRDVEVRRAPTGAPSLHVAGRAHEVACGLGIGAWLISLTHGAGTAVASVLALSKTS